MRMIAGKHDDIGLGACQQVSHPAIQRIGVLLVELYRGQPLIVRPGQRGAWSVGDDQHYLDRQAAGAAQPRPARAGSCRSG